MRVLVSDTSVLIDLERSGLLEAAFRLSWEFAVPDLLYKRELRDHNGPELLRLGLRVEALKPEAVHRALEYQRRVPALSLPDTFAITLAKVKGRILLAGDGELRRRATAEEIESSRRPLGVRSASAPGSSDSLRSPRRAHRAFRAPAPPASRARGPRPPGALAVIQPIRSPTVVVNGPPRLPDAAASGRP